MLFLKNIHTFYDQIEAVKGISLEVKEKEIVTLIGANGAGKTTTLMTLAGVLKPRQGEIEFNGERIDHLPAHEIVARGLALCPEGRHVFPRLTVRENLEMGAYLSKDQENFKTDMEMVFSLFPRLKERINNPGGSLSGGEQQMLSLSRALMSRPKMLILDEPSLGLAPILVEMIFKVIKEINQQQGMTILLVEQNAHLALEVAHRGYVLENGKITCQDEAKNLLKNPSIKKAYLGE